jgi:hypothetical protein
MKSKEFQFPRGRVNCQTHARLPRARDAWRKFTEIYGNPRACVARASRALCIAFLVAKNTVSCFHTATAHQHQTNTIRHTKFSTSLERY